MRRPCAPTQKGPRGTAAEVPTALNKAVAYSPVEEPFQPVYGFSVPRKGLSCGTLVMGEWKGVLTVELPPWEQQCS